MARSPIRRAWGRTCPFVRLSSEIKNDDDELDMPYATRRSWVITAGADGYTAESVTTVNSTEYRDGTELINGSMTRHWHSEQHMHIAWSLFYIIKTFILFYFVLSWNYVQDHLQIDVLDNYQSHNVIRNWARHTTVSHSDRYGYDRKMSKNDITVIESSD